MQLPACPRHPESRVWLDGTYGAAGRKRQRFKCVPADGGKRHVFTEALPRRRIEAGECAACERELHVHEGPAIVRNCTYSVREIAEALVRVGQGESYRQAGRLARISAGRPRPSGDGALVGDWVEAFAPLLVRTLSPHEWPASVLVAALPLAAPAAARAAWWIFAAWEQGGRLLRLEAHPDDRPEAWRRFFGGLAGTPRSRRDDASPLAEETFAWLRARLGRRRSALRNRERTNRLLSLVQLELSGRADVDVYAATLRRALEATGGRPPRRGVIDDRAGAASLRGRSSH